MGGTAEHLEEFKFKKGDPAPEGAGRPAGARNRPVSLPPIHVDGLPYPLVKIKRGESGPEYWNRQSTKVLNYMFKRMNAFIIYQERGLPDPLGAEIFKMLGKEIVKGIGNTARKDKNAGAGTGIGDNISGIKEYRKELGKLKASYVSEGEIINEDDTQQAGPLNMLGPSGDVVGDMDDEF